MWKRVVIYGILLAAGTLALQSLDYLRLVRAYPFEVYVFLIALACLALGILIGARVLARPAARPFDGNPQAQAALGISPRELTVLNELAAGHPNKTIAERLNISPDTVKTHVARLFDKLDAKRRTEAVRKARELGLLP